MAECRKVTLVYFHINLTENFLNSGNGNYIFHSHLAFITNKCFFFSFCSRHVLHVMFIMFSWAEWTQLACVFLQGRTSARFELIDHASNQVEASLHGQIFLIFFFLFFSPPQKPYQFLNLVLNIIAMSSTDVSVRLSQKLFVYKRQQTLKL